MNDVDYADEAGAQIWFSEYGPGVNTNVDTENSEMWYVDISGTEGLVSEKEGQVTIIWAFGVKYFILTYFGDSDTAIEIARKVVKIE